MTRIIFLCLLFQFFLGGLAIAEQVFFLPEESLDTQRAEDLILTKKVFVRRVGEDKVGDFFLRIRLSVVDDDVQRWPHLAVRAFKKASMDAGWSVLSTIDLIDKEMYIAQKKGDSFRSFALRELKGAMKTRAARANFNLNNDEDIYYFLRDYVSRLQADAMYYSNINHKRSETKEEKARIISNSMFYNKERITLAASIEIADDEKIISQCLLFGNSKRVYFNRSQVEKHFHDLFKMIQIRMSNQGFISR